MCSVSMYWSHKVTEVQFIAVNQQVTLQNQDPVLNAFADLLGLSLRMTEDQLCRDMMMATASSYNCTGGTNGDLPTNLTLSDIDDVVTTLISNDAVMVLDKIEGEDKFGTGPVRNSFIALAHTKMAKELDGLQGFLPKWNYPNPGAKTLTSEWGAVNNCRFLLSSVGAIESKASALGADVYDIFVQGMESLGIVEQDNFSSKFLYRPAVYSDPLFQNITLGTVFAQTSRILNDLWLTKVRATLK